MEQKKKEMQVTPDVKKKSMQKTHDVTKKEGATKLSNKSLESANGGVILFNPKGFKVLGPRPGVDSDDEFTTYLYKVIKDDGTCRYVTNSKEEAIEIAIKSGISTNIVELIPGS